MFGSAAKGNSSIAPLSCYIQLAAGTYADTITSCALQRTNILKQHTRLAWLTSSLIANYVRATFPSVGCANKIFLQNLLQGFLKIGMYTTNNATYINTMFNNDWRWVETFDAAGYASPRSKAITYTPAFTVNHVGVGPSQCMLLGAGAALDDDQ
jgi:hypothetical protein